ncbi:MAG: protein-disulfide reductase DsbD N-terminal domain-containing protein [Acidobacteriia bacterium]|nr:protein-disulfide reductase DsbD N-terminal domain-containing protein [Terriglobia bacterium]
MNFARSFFHLIAGACAVFCLLCGAPRGAAQTALPHARDVVAPAAYASLEAVPRGRTFELAVVLTIRRGFHINAHEVLDSYLIATELKPALPAGFQAGTILYPAGTQRKFAFSADKPMNVYQQTAVIRLPLTELGNAPLGEQKIPLKIRYQACSEDTCLPPVTLDFQAVVTVAAAGTKPRPAQAHAEFFKK